MTPKKTEAYSSTPTFLVLLKFVYIQSLFYLYSCAHACMQIAVSLIKLFSFVLNKPYFHKLFSFAVLCE